jgi:hypothetical protein
MKMKEICTVFWGFTVTFYTDVLFSGKRFGVPSENVRTRTSYYKSQQGCHALNTVYSASSGMDSFGVRDTVPKTGS